METKNEVVRLLRAVAPGHHEYDLAWAAIRHYGDDEDIRDREPSYGEQQRRKMLELATRIEGMPLR